MERLVIGEVLKPQGIRGEIKVKTFTDSPEDVKKFGSVYIDGAAYLGLRGVPDRNVAELLRGKKLEGDREDAPALKEGQYYIVDMIGLSCFDSEGEFLGKVKHIATLSSDIYTLEKNGKEILFPAVKGVVLKVDIANGVMTVDKKRFEEVAVL